MCPKGHCFTCWKAHIKLHPVKLEIIQTLLLYKLIDNFCSLLYFMKNISRKFQHNTYLYFQNTDMFFSGIETQLNKKTKGIKH